MRKPWFPTYQRVAGSSPAGGVRACSSVWLEHYADKEPRVTNEIDKKPWFLMKRRGLQFKSEQAHFEMIRKVTVKDAMKIHKLINHFAEKGMMLPRSLNDIYNNIRDFFIYEQDGKIIGCVALNIVWGNLAEIRSLAVKENHQKKAVGQQLVEACFDEAKNLGVNKIFVLTYKPKYFKRFGFGVVDKNRFPNKIWTDCVNCPKFPKCDEVFMVRRL